MKNIIKFWAELMAVALAFAGTSALGAITTQEAFEAAVANAASGATIELDQGTFDLNSIAVKSGKNMTFVGRGADKTTLEYGHAYTPGASDWGGVSCYSFSGSGLITFKSVTLKDVGDKSQNESGFAGNGGLRLEDCTITKQIGHWSSGDVYCKNCVFSGEGNDENGYLAVFWAGKSYVFEHCQFGVAGNTYKGCVQVYREDSSGNPIPASFRDCTFCKGNQTAKTPVYFYNVVGNGGVWDITVEGATNDPSSPYDKNATSGSWLWGDVKGNSTITKLTVNGATVWADGKVVTPDVEDFKETTSIATVSDKAIASALTPEEGSEAVTEAQKTAVKAVLENEAVAAATSVAEKTTTSEVVAALKSAASSTNKDKVTDSSAISTFVNVSLAAAETKTVAEQTVVKAMTFEVKPIAMTVVEGEVVSAVIPNAAITEAIVFRLPVDANATETKADVFHNGDKMGTYDVATVNDAKYIEVASATFSTFSYTLKEGGEEPTAVAKVIDATGAETPYETLQAAFEAAKTAKNVTIELLSNVDLKDVEWPSIQFNGTFDGKGYTISNLKVAYTQDHSGFIRHSDSGAVVKNVTFKDASITGNRASVVIGNGYGCTVENVIVDGGTITGIQKCGGIMGMSGEGSPLTITGCTVKNLALVYADFETEGNGGEAFGGLVGYVHYGVNVVITGNKVSGITFKGALDAAKFNTRYGEDVRYYQLICHPFIAAVLGTTDGKEVSVTLANNEVEPVDGLLTCPTTTDFMGFYYREGWTSMSVVDITIDGVLMPNRAVAEIGETKYYTLAEAVAAANVMNANPIMIDLLCDIEVTETLEIDNVNKRMMTFNAKGHHITAGTTMFNVKTILGFVGNANSIPPLPLAVVECPEEGEVITVEPGGTLGIQNTMFSKDVSGLLDPRKQICIKNGSDYYEVIPLTDELAREKGYIVKGSVDNTDVYYKTIADLLSDTAKTSVTINLINDVEEDIAVEKHVTLYAGDYVYSGSVSLGSKNFNQYSGTANLSALNCGWFSIGYYGEYGTVSMSIADGNVSDFDVYTYGELSITGGTYGKDPTKYIDAKACDVVNNGNGTWTVQAKAAYVAEIFVNGESVGKYETLAAALAAAGEHPGTAESPTVVQLAAGIVQEGDLSIAAMELSYVTFQGADDLASSFKDCEIGFQSGYDLKWVGVTFRGILWDNARIVFSTFKNENLTFDGNKFVNLKPSAIEATRASVHFTAECKNFTYVNNLYVDPVPAELLIAAINSNGSGLTGNITLTNNVIRGSLWRSLQMMFKSDDGVADNFTITDNWFEGNKDNVQIRGSGATSADTVAAEIRYNVFDETSDSIYFFNTDPAKTTVALDHNFWSKTPDANPAAFYVKGVEGSADNIADFGVYPYYNAYDKAALEAGTKTVRESLYNLVEPPVTDVAAVISADGATTNKFATLAAAIAAAEAGDTIKIIADVASEAVTVDKLLTITSDLEPTPELNDVSITAGSGIDLTVSQLKFTGGSYISAGAGKSLTVDRVVADVTLIQDPKTSPWPATNSRCAFISLGAAEMNDVPLLVRVSNCNLTVHGNYSPDVVFGWRFIANGSCFRDNVLGTAELNNFNAVKIMNFMDGALVSFEGNKFYSYGNGLDFCQNNSRDNSYAVVLRDNAFFGNGTDWIWVESSGQPKSGKINAAINAQAGNTVVDGTNPEREFLASDIRNYQYKLQYYGGVGVLTNSEGKLIGGTYSKDSNDGLIADGYEKIVNADSTWKVQEKTVTTKDEKPIVIDIAEKTEASASEVMVPITVTQDLAKEILGEGADVTQPLGEEQVTTIVTQLETKGEDGMTGWQKYAAGFSQTDKHPLAPKGKGGENGQLVLVTSLVAPKRLSVDTGVKVKYILKKATKVNPMTGVPDDGDFEAVQELPTPEFPVDVAELPPETYWKIDVEYTATRVVETPVEPEVVK